MMKNNIILAIGAIIIIAGMSIFILAVKEASATIITVDDDGGQDYKEIQDAVDNANIGDTIRVFEGEYKENVVVDKSLKLIGNGTENTTIDGDKDRIVFNISSDNVEISKFFITRSGNDYRWADGIKIYTFNNIISYCNISNNEYSISLDESSNNKISSCNISNNDYGIWFTNLSNNNTISNCNFSNNEYSISLGESSNNKISSCNISNSDYGIYLKDLSNYNTISNSNISNSFFGIWLTDSSNSNTISRCIISNDFRGIWLIDSSNSNTISSCNFFNNFYGICLTDSIYNKISSCNISNNIVTGINLYYSTNNTISDCIISNNDYGIYLKDLSNNTISSCNISNNNYGIWFISSSNNTISMCYISNNNYSGISLTQSNDNIISSCDISNNEYGIMSSVSSNNNIIFNNNFINNNQNAYDQCSNQWDNGKEGNYWDDYDGEDTNGDGIGEIPYNITGGDNKDRYPLVEPIDAISPKADAGTDKEVYKGYEVILDGSNSSDNIGIVNWTWNFEYNETIYILYAETTKFTFWKVGNYKITLTVKDSVNLSDIDSVWVNVIEKKDTEPPKANAGIDKTIKVGTKITFDGSYSTDNEGIINWTWIIDDNDVITLYGVTPKYIFNNIGNFKVTLTVKDSVGLTDIDTVWVNVTKEDIEQSTTGTITGIVKDEEGNAIMNARVILMDTTFTTKTDENGSYILENIPSRTYTIFVNKEGYLDSTTNVIVENEETTYLDIVLKKEKEEEVSFSIPIIVSILITIICIIVLVLLFITKKVSKKPSILSKEKIPPKPFPQNFKHPSIETQKTPTNEMLSEDNLGDDEFLEF